ncbi:MAG: hypothetical protein JNN01_25745 [Opitutaceae bacterium]|nr:hypothetical protein [Opitutaceae bacterium]
MNNGDFPANRSRVRRVIATGVGVASAVLLGLAGVAALQAGYIKRGRTSIPASVASVVPHAKEEGSGVRVTVAFLTEGGGATTFDLSSPFRDFRKDERVEVLHRTIPAAGGVWRDEYVLHDGRLLWTGVVIRLGLALGGLMLARLLWGRS